MDRNNRLNRIKMKIVVIHCRRQVESIRKIKYANPQNMKIK